MFPTVADVLGLEALRAGSPQVLAGASGLHRLVRWVHISELADIAGMLQGSELVLTTGIVLPDDRAGLTRYVDELADVGAAGLVVELGRRYERELPLPLVRAAERRGLPLVALRSEVRFVAVTEAVHALVVNSQLTELRASETVHQTFNELSVEGADAAEVVRQVARIAGAPVVLENLAHQVLAFEPAGRDPGTLLDGWERRSRGVHPPGRTGHDPRTGWLVTAVGARGQDWGRLVLVDAPEPAARHTVLLERGASTLALNRLMERDRESLERQTHRTLLSGILTHALTVSEVALRARALGVPLEGRRLVGVILRQRGVPSSAALEVQARLRDFTETVASAAREQRLTALVGALDDDGVGLLVSLGPHDDEHKALEGLARALDALSGAPGSGGTAGGGHGHEPGAGAGTGTRNGSGTSNGSGSASRATGAAGPGAVPGAVHGGGPGSGPAARAGSRAPGGGSFVMAAGSSVGSVRDARRSLLEAAQVADAAMHGGPDAGRRGTGTYYRLPDVRLRGLLHLLRDDARLQTYVERELGPLLAYDDENGTDLVRILAAYLHHGRNKSAAADAAHLSRPSFYDRLHRVERILGVDLDQVESCLSLHVALLALEAVRR